MHSPGPRTAASNETTPSAVVQDVFCIDIILPSSPRPMGGFCKVVMRGSGSRERLATLHVAAC